MLSNEENSVENVELPSILPPCPSCGGMSKLLDPDVSALTIMLTCGRPDHGGRVAISSLEVMMRNTGLHALHGTVSTTAYRDVVNKINRAEGEAATRVAEIRQRAEQLTVAAIATEKETH